MNIKKIVNSVVMLGVILSVFCSGVSAMAQKKVGEGGTGSISGILFVDQNGNGQQDPGEQGLSGILVKLIDSKGVEIPGKEFTTKEDGKYIFEGLERNKYGLKVYIPEGYKAISAGYFQLDENGHTNYVSLKEGEKFEDGSIGFFPKPATLNGTVFNDEDQDGKKGTTEIGIGGVVLELHQIGGKANPVATTTTTVNGKYSFTNIPPNEKYEVRAVSFPDKYEVVPNKHFDKDAKSVSPYLLKPEELRKGVMLALHEKTIPNIPAEDIIVEPNPLIKYVGETGTLKVTLIPADTTDKILDFKVMDSSIMTVDASGNWEAKKVGETVISVTTTNGKSSLVKVIVKEREVPVEHIIVEPNPLIKYVGETGTLKVTFVPENATNKELTFVSANPEIMSVDQNGNWVANKVGKTTITVTPSSGPAFVVDVTVKARSGVGATFYDYPEYLGYFHYKGTGTATNFDDDYNATEPYPGLGIDHYKVTKVGYVTVKDTGKYTFSVEIDDNATVYLDDEKIIDRDYFIGGTLTNFRYLKAGQTIKIQTEHFNRKAPVSYFHLRWRTPSNPFSDKAIPDEAITMEPGV
ncbi:SdrD B-like domain-containing protein [Candidatus Enterococcus mansonii]|uniref:PA14 domain-containing protein n=1 Tax=Candidatus Enterococcus mansonii TaxID=1834181 RepID=A0A242CHW5_9ENTE|nr:SdrD B-like domain-containing protein [Enterococcus sp. 4G2_DIV0659]OTO09834.1 hypothetical protein A5880_000517 [Enterococcus sp. 4G2_DIV0659]